MKRVIIAIQPLIRLHTFRHGEEFVETDRCYFGTVWGSSIEVFTHSFNLYDDKGYIVYTGAVKDLHALIPSECTFDDGYATEFCYEPIENHYV